MRCLRRHSPQCLSMMKTNKDNKSFNADIISSSEEKGIYIHIPFCVKKCIYCDFVSYPDCSDEVRRDYFDALKREAGLAAEQGRADSVFIGGGTPSLARAEDIAGVISCLQLKPGAEITIECNPGALDRRKLEIYRKAGINRISLGVQSFYDSELKFLGRIHSREQAFEAVEMVRAAGFDNINLDLIFGFPGQTAESWEMSLKTALSLTPEHLSFYSLQIEEGTPLYEMFRKDVVDQISDDVNRTMYHRALKMLGQTGYSHYEISNAALPGKECRHNLKYWSLKPYIGLGAAAHSFYRGYRYSNPQDISDYCRAVERKVSEGSLMSGTDFEKCSRESLEGDYIFTGLRLTEGMDTEEYERLFYDNFCSLYGRQIRELTDQGLVEMSGKRLKLTEKGLDLSNYVISEFLNL